jgi:hypothetical protein
LSSPATPVTIERYTTLARVITQSLLSRLFSPYTSLSRLHDREDTWVILAHEYEVEKVVPEDIDLSDWQNKGWKDKVAEERASASKLSCYA